MKRLLLIAGIGIGPMVAQAHVFPVRSDPRVGATVETPPSQMAILFDGDVEPVFSSIIVRGPDGSQVDKKDSHPDPQNNCRLVVTLIPNLPPSEYRVNWSVVARDTHRTEGHFTFVIKSLKTSEKRRP